MHITCPYLPDLLTTRLSTGPQQMTHGYTWTSLESRGEASKTMWATHVRHAKLCQTVPNCAKLCQCALSKLVASAGSTASWFAASWGGALIHSDALQCNAVQNDSQFAVYITTSMYNIPTESYAVARCFRLSCSAGIRWYVLCFSVPIHYCPAWQLQASVSVQELLDS